MYLKDALLKYYTGIIAKHQYNIDVYCKNSAGIGEHPDIIEAVDSELTKLVDAQSKLDAVKESLEFK